MLKNIQFRHSSIGDLPKIEAILQTNNLVTSDLNNPGIHFIIAHNETEIIACVGLEFYGTDALLRSFAVLEEYRNHKVGSKLIDFAKAFAHQNGVENIHLLTTTAKSYFEKQAFIEKDRSSAPQQIKNTKEFSSFCPSSSNYLVATGLNKISHYYAASLNVLKTNIETNAGFWAVSGEKISLSYFEVPSNTVFEKHSHTFEQITYVLEGQLYFEIDEKITCVSKSECIVIPVNVIHKVWTVATKAIAVDAWSTAGNIFEKR